MGDDDDGYVGDDEMVMTDDGGAVWDDFRPLTLA